ncbi:MAG: DUF5060 domain-containing protein [Planctomycetes bacterium]|nr:DUF5060 domain-containing protein [Planctomycetota bacterium]
MPRGFQGPAKGRDQTITFPPIDDLRVGGSPVELRATSDAGLPVEYYVARGPAVVAGGSLRVAEVPARATFPIAVEVVAVQFGSGVEPLVKTAAPVAQVIRIQEPVDGPAAAGTIERWGVFEATLRSSRTYANPFAEVNLLTAIFTCDDESVTVRGFHAGDGIWKIRCMPSREGRWSFRTYSSDSELNGWGGEFLCGPPAEGNHGPVRVARTWHFAYADGTPYFQVGTTCYAWVHQTEALQEKTLETLAASPFNKIRFCIFPKSYAYNRNDPPFFPFERKGSGTFDFTRPNPVSWRHLERRILDLQRLGIEADLILWHPYDRWGFAEMGDANDDRYLRYAIARLAAFRNVWWSLANEYDLMAPRTTAQGHRGDKTMEDWDRFFGILAEEDPFAHLRGIHNCRGFYDHAKPWVTHASIQSSDLAAGPAWREKYRKPVVYDECKYEGDIPQGWGNLSAEEMVHRFWLGTIGGCYVGHGETYRHPEDILWWSKGGVLHGQSPKRIAFLREILESAPFQDMAPDATLCPGNATLCKTGEIYFVYCLNEGPAAIELPGERPYKVDGIDTWEGTITSLGTARPGRFGFTPPKTPYLLRIALYRPGEPLLPEARIEAPARPPTAGDTSPGEPIVRIGTKDGDRPAAEFHGGVKRGDDGSFDLGAGEPWKWVSAGEGPIEALEGLRSFTICGWIKAARLEIGSGGNRIAFNLNYDRSGFDLVHLADGRLRLAVNEWPDRIANDSSPGKIVPGRWIFFAVAYDGTKGRDNVRWYFGDPSTPARLDRTTTYARGATGRGSGPLTIGNYNETIHRHGLDRQVRGALRDIAVFGSRIGGGGALGEDAIRRQQEGR